MFRHTLQRVSEPELAKPAIERCLRQVAHTIVTEPGDPSSFVIFTPDELPKQTVVDIVNNTRAARFTFNHSEG